MVMNAFSGHIRGPTNGALERGQKVWESWEQLGSSLASPSRVEPPAVVPPGTGDQPQADRTTGQAGAVIHGDRRPTSGPLSHGGETKSHLCGQSPRQVLGGGSVLCHNHPMRCSDLSRFPIQSSFETPPRQVPFTPTSLV